MLVDKSQEVIQKRLNRIAGQIEGIKKMVAEPRYCIEIMGQIAAARAALSSVGKFILEDHLKSCVTTSIRKGAGEREIKELLDVFEKF